MPHTARPPAGRFAGKTAGHSVAAKLRRRQRNALTCDVALFRRSGAIKHLVAVLVDVPVSVAVLVRTADPVTNDPVIVGPLVPVTAPEPAPNWQVESENLTRTEAGAPPPADTSKSYEPGTRGFTTFPTITSIISPLGTANGIENAVDVSEAVAVSSGSVAAEMAVISAVDFAAAFGQPM